MEPPGSNGFPFNTTTPFHSIPPTSKEGRSLYVGNLDPKANDTTLYEMFNSIGPVENCKIIKDRAGKNGQYGFVDFVHREDAQQALQLDGRKIFDSEIKVNWAVHARKDDSTNHHNIFVGDLSSDVTNELLKKAFDPFGTVTDARVMWDHSTGRSRGYGFVAFLEKAEADRAISEMDGKWLGSRTIRCNWANQKNTATRTPPSSHATGSQNTTRRSTNFEEISMQSPHSNSTIYVGNLPANTPESVVRSNFQNYGTIEEVRIQPGRCFGFVKFQTHDQATNAIIGSYDMTLGGQPIRCSWGKQKASQDHQHMGMFPHAQMYSPQYYSQQPYMYPYPYSQGPYYQPPDPNFYAQAFDPYAAYAMQYQQQQPSQMLSQMAPQQPMPQYMDGYPNPRQ